MQPREKPLQLRAGKLLLAVYGDNWCAADLLAGDLILRLLS